MKFPEHKCGLYLEHNACRDVRESVHDYLADWNMGGDRFTFRNEESRARCIATNEIWTLQWYPETPVSFYAVAAPTLEELLDYANSEEGRP